MANKDESFSKLELTLMFKDIRKTQDLHSKQNEEIKSRLDYTNGKVRKLYTWLTIVGAVLLTFIFTANKELATFILKLVV
jgi:hypothetical protein